MCMGGGVPADNSGEIARQQADERAAKITQGQKAIDTSFDSTFTPDYYDKMTGAYEDYYKPQVNQQYDDAKKQLTFNLARSGNSESTAGNDLFSRLDQQLADQNTQTANDAIAATGKQRGNVASQRSNLYSLNTSAADPTQAGAQAQQSALALQQPVSYSPLGSIFAGLINAAGNANAVASATSPTTYGVQSPSVPAVGTNTGSSYIRK